MAQEGSAIGPARGHVGFYLDDDRGYPALRKAFGDHASFGERCHDFVMAHPKFVYFGSILALDGGVAGDRPLP